MSSDPNAQISRIPRARTMAGLGRRDGPARGPMSSIDPEILQCAAETSMRHDLELALVLAICDVESGFDRWAVRFEPRWRWFLSPKTWAKAVRVTERTETICQQMSWGLMQVMGAVARERGFRGDLPSLCDPAAGLEYGCRHLKWNIDRWGNIYDALSAYNAGRPGTAVGGEYARKVLSKRSEFQLVDGL